MLLCLLVGSANGALTADNLHGWYLSLVRPPLTPPNDVFGPVWSVLYLMMGVAAWRVWRAPFTGALGFWAAQLAVNALWVPVFFGLHWPGAALLIIGVMFGLIALTILRFARVDRLAAWLMLPYLLWVGFASYLNAGFWWLNR
jgi:tryptophan-rich sensory protein